MRENAATLPAVGNNRESREQRLGVVETHTVLETDTEVCGGRRASDGGVMKRAWCAFLLWFVCPHGRRYHTSIVSMSTSTVGDNRNREIL